MSNISFSQESPGGGSDAPGIVFFGDSLTAGYGLSPDEAYPALIQEKIAAFGKNIKVVNAGVSGDTSSGGLRRVDWILEQRVDVFVLALGANDGLRGLPPGESKKNLARIIEKVQRKHPQAKIVLAGMLVPPNMGASYAKEFREMYTSLAETYKLQLLPFLLEGVAGIPKLNQADGVHPTAVGQRMIADLMWNILQPLVSAL